MKNEIVLGLDLSLNHSGFVARQISTGKVVYSAYITEAQKYLFKAYNGVFFGKQLNPETNNPETKEILRDRLTRKWFIEQLTALFDEGWKLTHAAIEGFSFASRTRSAYQIGALVGGIKSILYGRKVLMRVYAPKTIQSWANVSQKHYKTDMISNAVHAGYALPDDPKLLHIKGGKCSGPASDLADAFWLTDMLRMEILLRSGEKDMKNDLTDKQRKLLLATTGTRKVNYIYLDFIGELHKDVF